MNSGEYNEEKDVAKVTAEDLAECIIGPENFIICMPNEPPKPNIAVSEDVVLKKATTQRMIAPSFICTYLSIY